MDLPGKYYADEEKRDGRSKMRDGGSKMCDDRKQNA